MDFTPGRELLGISPSAEVIEGTVMAAAMVRVSAATRPVFMFKSFECGCSRSPWITWKPGQYFLLDTDDYSSMVMCLTMIGVTGRSPAAVLVVPIALTTSMPSVILPKTGCFDAPELNQSR